MKNKHDIFPHGTIICPNCGVAHSGLLDSIFCDECNKPFWSLNIIKRQVKYYIHNLKENLK